MVATAEVRWFFRGQAPARLAGWFEKVGAEPRQRADVYLRLPETDALGVKVRGGEGWLELKVREHAHGEQELSGGVAGAVEQWRKWSFQRTAAEPPGHGLGLPPNCWVTVHKLRRLATYRPPDWSPSLEPAQGDGCNVELTDLRAGEPKGVGDEEWSTLGLEAFGSEETVLESLSNAARALFKDLDLPQGLHADLSCGYPGWLRHLARHLERHLERHLDRE
ncbi:MAG TPA: hypothetical protein VII47_05305 [Actinomycetota bacterium]|jgi:hypothetical protein